MNDLRVAPTSLTVGWRTAAVIVTSLVTGSVGGTAVVLSELHALQTAIGTCSALPSQVESLDARVTALEIEVVRLQAR